MAEVLKFKVWCETDSKWEYVLATAEPTACPTNGGHTLRVGSTILLESSAEVNDGTAKELPLAEYKQLRYNEIDAKTQEVLQMGFTFDSETFSLSSKAQHNWARLQEHELEYTWPQDVTTIDHNKYSLTQANLSDFWDAAKSAIDTALSGGRDLKKQVYDAADEAAVDAVVDTR
jgi:hypothetical protein